MAKNLLDYIQHVQQCSHLLNVVVRQGTSILQLLTGEDQSLLVRRDTWSDS